MIVLNQKPLPSNSADSKHVDSLLFQAIAEGDVAALRQLLQCFPEPVGDSEPKAIGTHTSDTDSDSTVATLKYRSSAGHESDSDEWIPRRFPQRTESEQNKPSRMIYKSASHLLETARNNRGQTALIAAAANTGLETTERTLKLKWKSYFHRFAASLCPLLSCTSPSKSSLCPVTKMLLAYRADVIAIDNETTSTALMWAAETGNIQCMRALLLITQNTSPHMIMIMINAARQSDGCTALHRASEAGQLACAKLLISHGANVNARVAKDGCMTGATALILAAENGYCDLLLLLLSRKADINAVTNSGETALHLSSYNGNAKVVSLLLSHKSDVQLRDKDGSTALIHAASNGHCDIISLLLTHKADIDAANDDGWSALLLCAKYGETVAASLLVSLGANVNTRLDSEAENGFTPLMLAAKNGHCDIVKLLLSLKTVNIDIEATADNGQSALHIAAEEGQLAAVSMLLTIGRANVHAIDNDGSTALIYAASNGHCSIISLLLSHKADIDVANDSGYTALHFAGGEGKPEAVQLLLTQGVADVHARDRYCGGSTALMLAAANGCCEVLSLLLVHQADVNVTTYYGWTALFFAVYDSNFDAVLLLLSNKANVHARDEDGFTALMWAQNSSHCNDDILTVLLSHKDDIDVEDTKCISQGFTQGSTCI